MTLKILIEMRRCSQRARSRAGSGRCGCAEPRAAAPRGRGSPRAVAGRPSIRLSVLWQGWRNRRVHV